ncbi:MAG: hypothetical protein MJA83_08930 [Gammaproteobacteria bacterium]|nr:hypothetical protein [Gammaproteobacteria bacterium]
MVYRTKGNVFEALGFPKQEAANLRLCANLMITLQEYIRREAVTKRPAEEWLMMQAQFELNKARARMASGRAPARADRVRMARVEKQFARLADIRQMKSGVPAAEIQKKNGVFDGRRYRVKHQPFKG